MSYIYSSDTSGKKPYASDRGDVEENYRKGSQQKSCHPTNAPVSNVEVDRDSSDRYWTGERQETVYDQYHTMRKSSTNTDGMLPSYHRSDWGNKDTEHSTARSNVTYPSPYEHMSTASNYNRQKTQSSSKYQSTSRDYDDHTKYGNRRDDIPSYSTSPKSKYVSPYDKDSSCRGESRADDKNEYSSPYNEMSQSLSYGSGVGSERPSSYHPLPRYEGYSDHEGSSYCSPYEQTSFINRYQALKDRPKLFAHGSMSSGSSSYDGTQTNEILPASDVEKQMEDSYQFVSSRHVRSSTDYCDISTKGVKVREHYTDDLVHDNKSDVDLNKLKDVDVSIEKLRHIVSLQENFNSGTKDCNKKSSGEQYGEYYNVDSSRKSQSEGTGHVKMRKDASKTEKPGNYSFSSGHRKDQESKHKISERYYDEIDQQLHNKGSSYEERSRYKSAYRESREDFPSGKTHVGEDSADRRMYNRREMPFRRHEGSRDKSYIEQKRGLSHSFEQRRIDSRKEREKEESQVKHSSDNSRRENQNERSRNYRLPPGQRNNQELRHKGNDRSGHTGDKQHNRDSSEEGRRRYGSAYQESPGQEDKRDRSYTKEKRTLPDSVERRRSDSVPDYREEQKNTEKSLGKHGANESKSIPSLLQISTGVNESGKYDKFQKEENQNPNVQRGKQPLLPLPKPGNERSVMSPGDSHYIADKNEPMMDTTSSPSLAFKDEKSSDSQMKFREKDAANMNRQKQPLLPFPPQRNETYNKTQGNDHGGPTEKIQNLGSNSMEDTAKQIKPLLPLPTPVAEKGDSNNLKDVKADGQGNVPTSNKALLPIPNLIQNRTANEACKKEDPVEELTSHKEGDFKALLVDRLNICAFCQREFDLVKFPKSLIQHISEKHVRYLPYVCSYCQQPVTSFRYINEHMQKHQLEKEIKLQKAQGQTASQDKSEDTDNVTLTENQVNVNTITLKRKQEDSKNEPQVKEKIGRFSNKDNKNENNQQDRKLQCKYCKEWIAEGTDTNVHEEKCGEGQLQACAFCKQKYKLFKPLEKHICSEHVHSLPFLCTVCNISLGDYNLINEHMISHDSNVAKALAELRRATESSKENSPKKMNSGSQVAGKDDTGMNMGGSNIEEDPSIYNIIYCKNDKNERVFVCPKCTEELRHVPALTCHMNEHTKSMPTHVCVFCFEAFLTDIDLDNHVGNHLVKVPYTCTCGAVISHALRVNDHVMHNHTSQEDMEKIQRKKQKPSLSINCTFCNVVCNGIGELRQHANSECKEGKLPVSTYSLKRK